MKKMNNVNKILNAKIDEEIIITHDYIEKVKFTYSPNSIDEFVREHPYSWVAYTNAEHYHTTIFPMRSSSYVAFFKKELGAKRNFIKHYLKNDL